MSKEIELINILELFLKLYNQRTELPVSIYGDTFDFITCRDDYPTFCKYISKHESLNKFCKTDQKKRAENPSSPFFEYCHFGVANYKHPIFIKNKHFGTILAGKRRINEMRCFEEAMFHKRLVEIDAELHLTLNEKTTLQDEYNSISSIPEENFYNNCKEAFRTLESSLSDYISIHEKSRVTSKNTLMTTESLAHQLILPVTEIKGYTRLLKERLMDSKNDEALKMCELIYDSIEKFRIYAENLRGGVLNEERKFKFTTENLYDVVVYCAKPYRELARINGLELLNPRLEPHEYCYAKISKHEFVVALMNLVHNAVKYSYRGSERTYRYVDIIGKPSSEEKGCYEICVSNYGVGITPDEIKYRTICEKFKRGKLSRDRERIGTGLGLYVADQVIKKHGGQLLFTSDPIDGIDGPHLNKFTLRFPLDQNE